MSAVVRACALSERAFVARLTLTPCRGFDAVQSVKPHVPEHARHVSKRVYAVSLISNAAHRAL